MLIILANMKKWTLQGAILIVIAVIVSSCNPDSSIKEEDHEIVIGMTKGPNRINPLLEPTSVAREVYQYVFLPLADYDAESYKMEPILIEAIPVQKAIEEGVYKGAIAYDMRIKEAAVWENGAPITGYDFAFTLKAIKLPGTKAAGYRGYIEAIEDVEVDKDDPKSFRVIIDEDYMLSLESMLSIPVYPKYIYDSHDVLDEVLMPELNKENVADYQKDIVGIDAFLQRFNGVSLSRDTIQGAGPYTLSSWEGDQSITLKRKDNYWASGLNNSVFQAIPAEIKFLFIPDQVALLSQLKEGNVDVTNDLTAENFEELRTNEVYGKEFDFLHPELFQLYFIGLNNKSIKLNNPNLRTALSHLVDVPQLMNTLENGAGSRTVGIIHPNKPYYHDGLSPIEFNPDKAMELLSDEGWIDSNNNGIRDKMIDGQRVELVLDFYITGSELSRNMALIIKEGADRASVGINIIPKKFILTKKENLLKRNYDMVLQSLLQGPGLDDPYGKWHSDNDTLDRSNYYSYRSHVVDGVIELIQASRDEETRNQYYRKLQELMYHDQPAIFLYNPSQRLVISKEWKGKGISKRPGYMANTFSYAGDKAEK